MTPDRRLPSGTYFDGAPAMRSTVRRKTAVLGLIAPPSKYRYVFLARFLTRGVVASSSPPGIKGRRGPPDRAKGARLSARSSSNGAGSLASLPRYDPPVQRRGLRPNLTTPPSLSRTVASLHSRPAKVSGHAQRKGTAVLTGARRLTPARSAGRAGGGSSGVGVGHAFRWCDLKLSWCEESTGLSAVETFRVRPWRLPRGPYPMPNATDSPHLPRFGLSGGRKRRPFAPATSLGIWVKLLLKR